MMALIKHVAEYADWFRTGMTAFITDWSAVEVSVGVMGFDFKWIDQETNQVEEGRQRVLRGNFKIKIFLYKYRYDVFICKY